MIFRSEPNIRDGPARGFEENRIGSSGQLEGRPGQNFRWGWQVPRFLDWSLLPFCTDCQKKFDENLFSPIFRNQKCHIYKGSWSKSIRSLREIGSLGHTILARIPGIEVSKSVIQITCETRFFEVKNLKPIHRHYISHPVQRVKTHFLHFSSHSSCACLSQHLSSDISEFQDFEKYRLYYKTMFLELIKVELLYSGCL